MAGFIGDIICLIVSGEVRIFCDRLKGGCFARKKKKRKKKNLKKIMKKYTEVSKKRSKNDKKKLQKKKIFPRGVISFESGVIGE